ncbi:hypothetical protein [Alkalihalophilus marmarensis]|uniref:hypothetical protein n=1 Tax=Alkalihalophilus marmarensis TaxID=521377 RepID=UPI002E210936|nr:hypothetical protein [Alkalihalophilus marmarensis]
MRNHTLTGKWLFWIGFIVFMTGVGFTESVGAFLSDDFPSLSVPLLITGGIIMLATNFFRNKKTRD